MRGATRGSAGLIVILLLLGSTVHAQAGGAGKKGGPGDIGGGPSRSVSQEVNHCGVCHPSQRVAHEVSVHAAEGVACHSCHGGDPATTRVETAHRCAPPATPISSGCGRSTCQRTSWPSIEYPPTEDSSPTGMTGLRYAPIATTPMAPCRRLTPARAPIDAMSPPPAVRAMTTRRRWPPTVGRPSHSPPT
jgi:hypothetical protein